MTPVNAPLCLSTHGSLIGSFGAVPPMLTTTGTVKNVSYSNFVLENVGQAIMMNVFEQGRDATHIVGYDQNIGVSSFENIR